MRLIERLFDLFRTRSVSLYVEWETDEGEDAIITLLQREGARNVWVDEDADLEQSPCGGIVHAHSVFRFRIDRQSVYEALSAVAMYPPVFSISIV